ncbi:hypothetical protein [Marinicauda sp. Alg238-R41]|jgi:hypothetical protein|uniref:hypothetical protein n=1 Tax=Marinicauda sp. Alg238-R41 TaxID=2993447 RepID=UPI0022DF9A73|nr:hypothetical protein [Marinicauda sp. Alg238-R41]
MTQRTLGLPQDARSRDPRAMARLRAEAIKAKVSIADLAELREADVTPTSEGWRCDCPSCRGVQTVRIWAHGERCRCEAAGCTLEGDVVTFEMAASGAPFAAACASLEEAYSLPGPDGARAGGTAPAARDDRTCDLFGGGHV